MIWLRSMRKDFFYTREPSIRSYINVKILQKRRFNLSRATWPNWIRRAYDDHFNVIAKLASEHAEV